MRPAVGTDTQPSPSKRSQQAILLSFLTRFHFLRRVPSRTVAENGCACAKEQRTCLSSGCTMQQHSTHRDLAVAWRVRRPLRDLTVGMTHVAAAARRKRGETKGSRRF
jgi:hypothetical protein